MSRRISSAEEQALGGRLRREAMEAWPAYSETLHNRIITAIEQRRSEEATVSGGADIPVCPRHLGKQGRHECLPHRGEKRWSVRLAAACTAVCLLCAVVLGWRLAQRGPQQDNMDGKALTATGGFVEPMVVETAVTGLPPIGKLAGSAVDNLNGLLASAAVAPQSAELEHDTRLAAKMLLERLPIDVELVAGP